MKTILLDCIKKEKPNAAAFGAFNQVLSMGGTMTEAKKAASEAAKSDGVTFKSALQKEYENLKLKYPDAVIWFSIDGHVETFSDSAVKTSDVLKTALTNRPDNDLALTGFSSNSLDENLKKMLRAGYKVALVESSFQKKKESSITRSIRTKALRSRLNK